MHTFQILVLSCSVMKLHLHQRRSLTSLRIQIPLSSLRRYMNHLVLQVGNQKQRFMKCKSLQDNCSKEEGDDFPQEIHSFSRPSNMDENKIQESLHLLHDTHASVSHQCWITASLEDQSSLESKEEMQKALSTIQGEFLKLLYDRDDLIEVDDVLHGSSLKDGE